MMKNYYTKVIKRISSRHGQSTVEYILILGAVVIVVLVAMKSLLPKTTKYSNSYFNKVSVGILGNEVGYRGRGMVRNYP